MEIICLFTHKPLLLTWVCLHDLLIFWGVIFPPLIHLVSYVIFHIVSFSFSFCFLHTIRLYLTWLWINYFEMIFFSIWFFFHITYISFLWFTFLFFDGTFYHTRRVICLPSHLYMIHFFSHMMFSLRIHHCFILSVICFLSESFLFSCNLFVCLFLCMERSHIIPKIPGISVNFSVTVSSTQVIFFLQLSRSNLLVSFRWDNIRNL